MTASMPELDELLRRAAGEIRQCRSVVRRLEDVVQVLVEAQTGAPGAARAMHEIQSIDLLDQRLRDLAQWTEALAASVEGCKAGISQDELSRVVLLTEMRRALGGHEGSSAVASRETEIF